MLNSYSSFKTPKVELKRFEDIYKHTKPKLVIFQLQFVNILNELPHSL